MNPPLPESLLAALRAGQQDVVEQIIEKYEPYLRIVVRRMLTGGMRAKLDSMDVVQSVWADVWDGLRQQKWQFESEAQLRAFLIAAVRHRLIDHARHNRRALAAERPLSDHASLSSEAVDRDPSQSLEADELWEQLLASCPREHHEILHLRRSGATLECIAHQRGLHESSVRRILYQLARRVFSRLRPVALEAARCV